MRIAGEEDRSLYFLTWTAIVFVTLAIHIVSDQIAFADAQSYLFYVDNLYFYRAGDWFLFEPLSKLILILMRDLTGNTVHTVAGAHYFISIVYLLGTLVVFPPSEGNWRGLVMAFALYGSQLEFVTIRATPAYFLAAIAVVRAVRGDNRAFVFAGLAVLFHISAVLAFIPILAIFFKAKVKKLSVLQKPRTLLIALGAISVSFAFIGPTIFSVTRDVFQSIPFLGKYLVFAVGMSDTGGVSTIVSGFAVGHIILFISITAFVMSFLIVKDDFTRNVGIFVIISYVFYSFTFFAFSPIAAFRQTPYWMLPAFSIFPWHRIGWRGIGHFVFLALATGIFLFQFSRVI